MGILMAKLNEFGLKEQEDDYMLHLNNISYIFINFVTDQCVFSQIISL